MNNNPMKCGVYDSPFTERGTKRKNIVFGSCGLGLTHEAKWQAKKDFTAQKQPINKIEKISPFVRKELSSAYFDRERKFWREEWRDAAAQYIKYIL
jgi:hypothetical protein